MRRTAEKKGLPYQSLLNEILAGKMRKELELVEQQLQFGLGLGGAGQDKLATVSGGQVHVNHLHDTGVRWYERGTHS